jgi:phage shock protein A
MSFLNKMKSLLNKWFSSNSDDREEIKKAMVELDQRHVKLKDALTSLYFQQARLTDKKELLQSENMDIGTDLEQAATENRDELAIHLIEKLDKNKEELLFLQQQLTEIENDIEVVLRNKKEMEIAATRYKEMLVTYDSRYKALQARKELKTQIGELRNSINSADQQDTLSKLKEKIHYLNAEMNLLNDGDNQLEKQLSDMRQGRLNQDKLKRLDLIKQKLQDRSAVVVK